MAVGPVDCALHAGEVVGLVGLRGAGQESVGRALFGLLADHRRPGRARRRAARRDLAAARRWTPGINLVCADRVGESVMPEPQRPREPVPQSRRRRAAACSRYLAPRRESRGCARARRAGRPAAERPERCRSSCCPAATSRRWWSAAGCISAARSTSSRTRPPASTSAPRRRSTGCSTSRSQAGAAILIVSTDFEEVAKICHRALVFDRGRVVAELGADDLSVENLLAAASARVGRWQRLDRATQRRQPCSPLSRTRSSRRAPSSPACRAGRRIGRLLPVYGLPILTRAADRLLLAAPAADLPDLSQPPLDPRRQGDHRAARRSPR